MAKKAKDFIEDAEGNPIAAAAETIVKLNPELELVESDREGGKITIREKDTGKESDFQLRGHRVRADSRSRMPRAKPPPSTSVRRVTARAAP